MYICKCIDQCLLLRFQNEIAVGIEVVVQVGDEVPPEAFV